MPTTSRMNTILARHGLNRRMNQGDATMTAIETITETPVVAVVETPVVPTPKARKPKTPKAPVIETPKAPTKAQQKALDVAARKVAREEEKVRKAEEAKNEKLAKEEAKAVVKEVAKLDGYELAEGADLETVIMFAGNASIALDQIGEKDKALVGSYLVLGEFQSKVAPMFKSTKIYGQFLKDKLPGSQNLDPALRSNCKWLFENLGEVTQTLVPGANSIEAYKSANPTVIRRDYKAAKDAADKLAKAEESEKTVEELEAEEKANAKEEAKKADADLQKGLEQFQTWLAGNKKKDRFEQATLVLQQVIMQKGNKADIAKLLIDLGADTTA